MANFTLDMSKFADKSLKEIDQNIRSVALNLTTDIILGTPVDTGRARSNWFVTFEKASKETTDSINYSNALSNAQSALESGVFKNYIYIANNLDYILGLEYGSSKQAPQGFVRRNVERLKSV